MKTGTLLFLALVMPFGCFILAGMGLKYLLDLHRRRQAAATAATF